MNTELVPNELIFAWRALRQAIPLLVKNLKHENQEQPHSGYSNENPVDGCASPGPCETPYQCTDKAEYDESLCNILKPHFHGYFLYTNVISLDAALGVR